MSSGHSYNLRMENSSRCIILREGQSFALNGLIAEIDSVDLYCGKAPNYIPAWIRDTSGCVLYFNEIFQYNDFFGDAGAIELLEASVMSTCEIEVQYSLEVK